MRLNLIVSILIVSITPAAADWQYTKWGMTVAQVQAASKGKLRPCDAQCAGHSTSNATVRLRGEYNAGEFAFSTWAAFDNQGRLNGIRLGLLDPSQVTPLIGSVRAKYGEPESGSRGSSILNISTWRDRTDQISLTVIGSSNAELMYSPRVTPSNAGL
ncbi:hypothetical protein [Tardiphaga sp.]|uniref:hypothetical protein n=1 Tax=Tardiphaga sp. TaxID=1926292 RepID=UPI00260C3667|nr:hypothetical protein [Tardiphaga sp.]MDB5615920.1 hypothetical protein [Tardiphaga sp.]